LALMVDRSGTRTAPVRHKFPPVRDPRRFPACPALQGAGGGVLAIGG
jgi:hypothetical protein